MNKFRELETRLKDIINLLDKQIETKQKDIKDLSCEIDTTNTQILDLEELLNKLIEKLNSLEEIKGKSIIIEHLKNNLKGVYEELKSNTKNKKWFNLVITIISFLTFNVIYIMALILDPTFFVLAIGVFLLLFGAVNEQEITSLRRLKKYYTIEQLEKCICDIKRDINDKKIANTLAKEKNRKLYMEMQNLQNQRQNYIQDLERVCASEAEAIEELATPILDAAFLKFNSEAIIKRIREKEGINNG